MATRDEQAIDEEAIQWFVLLRDEDASDDDRSRFREWLAASPDHARAWREVERMWSGLDPVAEPAKAEEPSRSPLPGPGLPEPDSPEPASNVVALQPRSARPGRGWRGGAIAATILIAVAVGWQLAPVGLFSDYRSGIGERRVVLLDDGSRVELGTESALDVDFSDGRRGVTLVAGEAFFTVAKDPARPFVVAAGQGEVAVLGTAFNVRLHDDATVAVVESVVAVSAAADMGVRVSEGQMVHFGPNGVSAVEEADLDRIVAWRSDRIVFRDAPLAQVVAELQRYRRDRIQIIGSGISDKRVTAVFDTRRLDAALDTIAQSLGLRITHVAGVFTAITGG